eukprot:TRINITY_DN3443_c0_g1_i13.p1 TRINITY_DN3443_c0_g1~~TRINITY_DN3443_c0_g1_i13.p1  ORF type:complete len:116 (-),score=11.33 TRINITY_DN3443_c0_g1_i13:654-1001(-)
MLSQVTGRPTFPTLANVTDSGKRESSRNSVFRVGPPDNLVNLCEFFNLIELKLRSLVCIYCNKTFKNSEVLRQHMRKKQHLRIHPKNSEYDRFYLVNYLENATTMLDAEDSTESY